MSAADFLTGVERLLIRAHELFPAGGGEDLSLSPGAAPAPPAPSGVSSLADGATGATDRCTQVHTRVQGLDTETAQAANQAAAIGAGGRAGSGAILNQARAQGAALLPLANTAAGAHLLMAVMDQHLAATLRVPA
uniref:hypothetical protein n=1 Tax=Mycobacterium avium TaxID=1764 RepID=UPI0009FF3C94|nr:hypothetical protein [Mycobacterium avium]